MNGRRELETFLCLSSGITKKKRLDLFQHGSFVLYAWAQRDYTQKKWISKRLQKTAAVDYKRLLEPRVKRVKWNFGNIISCPSFGWLSRMLQVSAFKIKSNLIGGLILWAVKLNWLISKLIIFWNKLKAKKFCCTRCCNWI